MNDETKLGKPKTNLVFVLCYFLLIVLDKKLKGIRGVRLDNRKVFFVHHVLGPNILSFVFYRSIHCNDSVNTVRFILFFVIISD